MQRACPSWLEFAQWQTGEAEPARAVELEAHVAGCSACAASLHAMKTRAAQYGSRADEHAARLRERLSAERRKPARRLTWTVPALAAAAVLIFALVQGPPVAPEEPAPPYEVAFKGGLTLRAVASRGEDQFTVTDGACLRPGDRVRFVITAPIRGYVSVFSVDGRGLVSPFYPETQPARDPAPLRLDHAGVSELPGSVIMDTATGPEWLVVVFSGTTFSRAPVHEAMRQALSAPGARIPTPESLGIQGQLATILVERPNGSEANPKCR